MSTLQVANIHLESTANNRIQYTGSNTVTFYAGGVGTVVVNSTSLGGLTALSVGNTTANIVSNTTVLRVANSTGGANLNPTQLVIGTSVVNATSVNAAAIYDGGSLVLNVADADQTITGGFIATSLDLGTVTTGTTTLDMGARPLQHYTNNGAHTLAPGSNTGTIMLDILNGASAGAITTSGWTHVAGESFTTTNTNKFRCHCSVGNNGSLLIVEAFQ